MTKAFFFTKSIPCTLLAALFPLVAECQDLNLFGVFPVLSNTQVISNKIDLNFLVASKISAIGRTIAGMEYPPKNLEVYFQAQASYKIKPHLMIGLSYGWQRNNPFVANYFHEHRIAQQVILSLPIHKSAIYQRLRLEERFIETIERTNFQQGTRLRYQLGFTKPLSNSLYLNVSEEIFLITSGPRNAVYSENMAYAALGKKFLKLGNIEAGLVYNPVVRNSSGDVRNLYLLQLLWSTSAHWKETKRHPLLHFRHF